MLEDDEEKCYENISESMTWSALQQSNTTRWNSNAVLTNSFLNKQEVLNYWLIQMSHHDLALTEDDCLIITELSTYFTCFSKVTKLLQGRKYATIHRICLIYGELKDL